MLREHLRLPSPHPGPLPQERENRSQRWDGATRLGFTSIVRGCSLSRRERVRVRGNAGQRFQAANFLTHIIRQSGQIGIFQSQRPCHGLRLAVVFQHGVAALDVFEIFQHRLGGHRLAARAEMPLQVTNPQHQLGNGRGARIDFEAEKLVRVNRVRVSFPV